jgi:endonuclease-3
MLRGQALLARGATLAHPRRRAGLAAPPPPGALAALLCGLASATGWLMGTRGAAATRAATCAAVSAAEPAPAATPPPDAAAGAGAPAAAGGSAPRKPRTYKKATDASLHVTTNLRVLQPKALAIAAALEKLYPPPLAIPLDHATPFQLLCAVVLSAQTTDKKVNEVTPELFRLAPDAPAMAALGAPAIAAAIRQLGLAPTKARHLAALSAALAERHGGAPPATFAELEALPGVGHKTASVVMAQAHGHAAFPVDTHIHRLAQRWGLTGGRTVEQTEADLKLLFPEDSWRDLHLRIIFFGRERCPARGHDPAACPVCAWAAVPPYDRPGTAPPRPGERPGGASPVGRKRAAGAAGASGGAAAAKKPAAKRSRKKAADEGERTTDHL